MALQETSFRGLHHVAYNNRKYKSKLSSCTVPINFTEGWMMSCVPRCKNRKQIFYENRRHFAAPPLAYPRNDVRGTTAEIPYWSRGYEELAGRQLTVIGRGWAKYRDQVNYLSKLKAQVNNWCARHWQITIFNDYSSSPNGLWVNSPFDLAFLLLAIALAWKMADCFAFRRYSLKNKLGDGMIRPKAHHVACK